MSGIREVAPGGAVEGAAFFLFWLLFESDDSPLAASSSPPQQQRRPAGSKRASPSAFFRPPLLRTRFLRLFVFFITSARTEKSSFAHRRGLRWACCPRKRGASGAFPQLRKQRERPQRRRRRRSTKVSFSPLILTFPPLLFPPSTHFLQGLSLPPFGQAREVCLQSHPPEQRTRRWLQRGGREAAAALLPPPTERHRNLHPAPLLLP